MPRQFSDLSSAPFPHWLRVKAPKLPRLAPTLDILRRHAIHTVCEEARCPNIGDCWAAGTATFMILGDICTRRCAFCAVTTGRPAVLDKGEPERVATAAAELGLRHVVITSVARDDLADGGASHFARTTEWVKRFVPGATVEVLTPDFKGLASSIDEVCSAAPEVYNHNLETVPRLQSLVRPAARFERSLQVLQHVKQTWAGIATKSGIMLGLGEEGEEALEALQALREVGCQMLTIGQYLRPTRHHHPVVRYVPPEEFDELGRIGRAMGFAFVASGPFVRSSFHAAEAYQALRQPTPAAAG